MGARIFGTASGRGQIQRWSVGLSCAFLVFSTFVGPMFGPSLSLPTCLLKEVRDIDSLRAPLLTELPLMRITVALTVCTASLGSDRHAAVRAL